MNIDLEEVVLWAVLLLSIIAFVLGVSYIIKKSNSITDSVRCVGGYEFVGSFSHPTQIIDANGHGIPCKEKER